MLIAPSILNADNMHLGKDIKRATMAGVMRFHIDIMDAHFVPNLSYGPQLVKDFKKEFSLVDAEIHLMSDSLETMVPAFIKAGADILEFHYEATNQIDYWLDYLTSKGVRAGIVLNPDTPVEMIEPYLDKLDQVLLMSVYPGFGGQKFKPETIDKIKKAKKMIGSRRILIEVDGGINYETGKKSVAAGADILVAGSYIFQNGDIEANVYKLNELNK